MPDDKKHQHFRKLSIIECRYWCAIKSKRLDLMTYPNHKLIQTLSAFSF